MCSETHCRKTEVIMEKLLMWQTLREKERVYKVPLECNGEDGIRLSCKKNSNEYRTLDVCLMEVCYLNKLWTRGFWRIWQHKKWHKSINILWIVLIVTKDNLINAGNFWVMEEDGDENCHVIVIGISIRWNLGCSSEQYEISPCCGCQKDHVEPYRARDSMLQSLSQIWPITGFSGTCELKGVQSTTMQ